MNNKILIIDLETTAFRPDQGCIVEVGVVSLNLDDGHAEIVMDTVCCEERMTAADWNAWIFHNSDLTVEAVRSAKAFGEIAGELQLLIDAHSLGCTAYNKSFDFGWLEARGISIPKKLDCPMMVATPVLCLPYRDPSKKGYKWPTVEEAWQYLFPDKTYIEKHRGADDALHEALIVYELYRRGHFKVKRSYEQPSLF